MCCLDAQLLSRPGAYNSVSVAQNTAQSMKETEGLRRTSSASKPRSQMMSRTFSLATLLWWVTFAVLNAKFTICNPQCFSTEPWLMIRAKPTTLSHVLSPHAPFGGIPWSPRVWGANWPRAASVSHDVGRRCLFDTVLDMNLVQKMGPVCPFYR